MKTTPPGSRNHESLEVIHQAGVRARDLVHRILTFARKTEPTRSPIDLGASTAAAVKLLRATLPSLIKIHERVERVPRILADETQIHQIIINLATNAAQAIEGQMGTITVQVAPAISSADSSPAVRLSVIDTGCGMDAATRSRIFEPFFTTKSTGEGTGLGLSVVNGIVTAHGAAISVESELGKGTRFDILFPAATEGGS